MILINTSHIGIDLGSRYIKIALLGLTPEERPVNGESIYPVKGNIGDKRYFKSLRQNIKDFVEEQQLGIISMSFTISPFVEGMTTANILRLPRVDNKILKKAASFELEQRDIIKNIQDHHVLFLKLEDASGSAVEDAIESDVLLTTIKKSLIYEIAQLRKLKWKVENIELQVSTIDRFVSGNAVVIDFGHQSTRLYFFKQNTLRSIEVVGNGGEGVNEAIQTELNAPSFDVAEDLKHQSALYVDSLSKEGMNESLIRTAQVVADESEFLISEIKRIIRGFELREFIELDHAYYTGGLAQTESFVRKLTNELEYDVTPFAINMGVKVEEPLDKSSAKSISFGLDVPAQDSESIEDEFSDFFKKTDARASSESEPTQEKNAEIRPDEPFSPSLFLKKNEPPLIESELGKSEDSSERTPSLTETETVEPEPTDEPEKPEGAVQWTTLAYASGMFRDVDNYPELNYGKFMKYKVDVLSFLIAVAIMSLTLQVGVSMISSQYDENIQQLSASIAEQNNALNETNEAIDGLNREKSESEELVSRITGLQSQKKWYAKFLFQLPDKTPGGVSLEHVNLQTNEVTLSGYSTDYSNIGFLAMALEELGETKIVEITDIEDSQKYVSQIEGQMTKSFTLTVQQ